MINDSDIDVFIKGSNEKYRCMLSGHQGGILWSIERRFQKLLSSSLETCRSLDLLLTNLPSVEHSGI